MIHLLPDTASGSRSSERSASFFNVMSHERETKRNSSLPVSLQACVAMRFFAQGWYLATIGDIHHVSKSTACLVLDSVAKTLSEKLPEYQGFPDFQKVKADFFHYGKLPKVIGCIDGTHVEIKKPATNPLHKPKRCAFDQCAISMWP